MLLRGYLSKGRVLLKTGSALTTGRVTGPVGVESGRTRESYDLVSVWESERGGRRGRSVGGGVSDRVCVVTAGGVVWDTHQ